MKLRLTEEHVRAAVVGGAILGGGGGSLEEGFRLGQLAIASGTPELWSADELPSDAITATVALVGAPGAVGACVKPESFVRAVELLASLGTDVGPIAAINSNENGGTATVNGWYQAAVSGLPVLDVPCNGRAHPTGMMGALGLHEVPEFVAHQAFSGGAGDRYLEGAVRGGLEKTAALIRHASVAAGGLVAVARNPVPVRVAKDRGAPGGISHAMAVGETLMGGGPAAVAKLLHGRIVASGKVVQYRCRQRGGFDVGGLTLDDRGKTILSFVNEYMTLRSGRRLLAAFPDLIMTFDAQSGDPLPSANVHSRRSLIVLVAPRSSLKLSVTMSMPELLEPVERLLGGTALGTRKAARRR